MDKRDETALSADTRVLVNEANAVIFEPLQRRLDITGLDGYVMDAAASFLKEFADRRVVTGRLEQLNATLANGQHGNADLLVLDDLGVDVFQT